jgi:hypothetical protein
MSLRDMLTTAGVSLYIRIRAARYVKAVEPAVSPVLYVEERVYHAHVEGFAEPAGPGE